MHVRFRLLIVSTLLACVSTAAAQDGSELLYDTGDPTDDQQLLVELINRARADPAGEGDRIAADYGSADVKAMVDGALAAAPLTWTRAENQTAWKTYAPQPPMVFNRALARAANQWSVAMRVHDLQAQTISGEPGLFTRISQAGYSAVWSGQLINGVAADVLTAHASWTIDPGQAVDPATGRPGIWNRLAIINPRQQQFLDFVEVGPGLVRRNNPPPGGLGPLIATLVLAEPSDPTRRYVTGVVFDDKDGDGAWDRGEGLPGVRIDVDRSSFYAVSSRSGGYAIPVNGNAGSVQVTARGLPSDLSEIFRTQTVQGTTLAFGRAGNVKADFVLLPRLDPPPVVTFDATPGAVDASDTTAFAIPVAGVHADRALVGDVDLAVDLAHANRGQVRLRLVSPSGTEVTLWESTAAGLDLIGSFDASLRPDESLRAFVDEPWAGTWTLFVDDASGQPGALRSATLSIRPRWEGPLFSRRAHLFVTKLDVKDKNKPGKDALTVALDAETGGALDLTGPLEIVLRTGGDAHAELIRLDVAGALAAGGSLTTADGELSVQVTPSFRDTSRARVAAKLRGADLPAIAGEVRVELLAGDSLLVEDVKVTRGRFRGKRTAPLGAGLRLERVRSKIVSLGRRTVVRGRYMVRGAPFVAPVAELRVGDVSALWRAAPLVRDESRIEYPRTGNVKRLIVNPRRGTFKAVLDGGHEILDADGRVRASLWLGAFYGEAEITPAVGAAQIDY